MIKQERLLEALDYINRFIDENGFPPTVRDMCKDLGIKSTATAYDYVNRLRDQGYLSKVEGKKRAVAVRNNCGSSVRVPILGVVNAGQPILAIENNEGYIPLPQSEFKGEEIFLLRVQGESMIEAGILNGDKIVVRRQETAENGDIVVAMFNDGTFDGATVKRFFVRGGKVILHPENSSMEDIIPENRESVVILGKVIGLLRTL